MRNKRKALSGPPYPPETALLNGTAPRRRPCAKKKTGQTMLWNYNPGCFRRKTFLFFFRFFKPGNQCTFGGNRANRRPISFKDVAAYGPMG
jgi:hypothetical protein